jgi:hypothetical protein
MYYYKKISEIQPGDPVRIVDTLSIYDAYSEEMIRFIHDTNIYRVI